jgi:hypothetical protein
MDAKRAAIPEIFLNNAGQVTHTQNNIVHAVRFQMMKHMLYKGTIGDRLHRLGPMNGQWPQACSLTTYQNHCFQVETPWLQG